MNKLYAVTIGIPAHNEAHNLPALLHDIALQEQTRFHISQVVVVSDASTDDTATVARTYQQLPMRVVVHAKRKGKASALNTIFSTAKTDAVIILDADVRLLDRDALKLLMAPIIAGDDLAAAQVMELPPTNFFQRILDASMKWKKNIYRMHREGNNIFTCHGRARAFSKKLYSQLRFPVSAGEDAYSYLFCVKHGFKYHYVDAAHVYYYLPTHLADHALQSIRYFDHDNQLRAYFSPSEYRSAYQLPVGLALKQLAHALIQQPIELVLYIAIAMGCKMYAPFYKHQEHAWSIARSSK